MNHIEDLGAHLTLISSNFSRAKHPIDSGPVFKLKFVCCGPGKNPERSIFLGWSLAARWSSRTPFPNSENWELYQFFQQISRIFKKFSGDQFKI